MKEMDWIFAIIFIVIIAIVCVFVFTIFYISSITPENETPESQTGMTIIDDYGRTVKIPKTPEKIISVAPSATEILFAVGLGDKVIGVDEYSDYPIDAKSKTKIGTYLAPNLEIIVSMSPDLIFASDMTSEDNLAMLEKQGLIVVILAPNTIDEMIEDIKLVGRIGNKNTEANMFADSLEKRIDDITSKTNQSTLDKPKVYIEYYPYWTYGPGSFGNDLISMAGGINIAAQTTAPYVEITDEFIVGSNPEIIIFTVGPMASTTLDDITSRSGLADIDAIKHNKIYPIDDDLISRPGPRIVDGLEELAKIIHPDLFS